MYLRRTGSDEIINLFKTNYKSNPVHNHPAVIIFTNQSLFEQHRRIRGDFDSGEMSNIISDNGSLRLLDTGPVPNWTQRAFGIPEGVYAPSMVYDTSNEVFVLFWRP